MKTFKDKLQEQSYKNNLGFSEMMMFYQEASEKQIKEMERVAKAEDWEGFKKLIHKVLGVKLQ